MNVSPTEAQSSTSHFAPVASLLTAIGSLAVLIVLSLYIRGNDSNHTSFEPWLLSIVFVTTVFVSIFDFRHRSSRWASVLAFCLGFGGMSFLYCLDHFNIMVQYDRWIERGMP